MNDTPQQPETQNSKLRIVHTEASCGWGGQEIRILGEAVGMQQRGHDVVLLCPEEAPIYNAARERGIETIALPVHKRNLQAFQEVRKWLSLNSADIVNTHSSRDTWLLAVASKFSKQSPALVRTRHVSTAVGKNPFTSWLYKKASRYVVTTGERLRKTLISHNGLQEQRVISVPTGIDTQHFCPGDKLARRTELGLPADKRIVGIVATLRSWKGHEHLIDAFAQLNRQDTHLLIVGDGPMRDRISAQIAERNLDAQVTRPGQQSDVVPWMQAMDLFCLPSYANEGVPQSIMQAMSCGLPVISTHVGAIDEAVVDGVTGQLIEPAQVELLSETIASLLDDPNLLEQFGSAGRARAVERFGTDRMLDQMESIFHQAVRAA